MTGQLDSEALRSLVREILREAIPDGGEAPALGKRPGPRAASRPAGAPREESVSIGREALRSGRHAFRLARAGGGGNGGVQSADGGSGHLEKGVLSEARLVSLAKSGKRITLGRGVTVTPLAKDKARQLGVKLERER